MPDKVIKSPMPRFPMSIAKGNIPLGVLIYLKFFSNGAYPQPSFD
jgi:hypothetical protein|tara:strand:- start:611 stop:745 length:135 start_codon:yes stop_codon:yes gene_type:complete